MSAVVAGGNRGSPARARDDGRRARGRPLPRVSLPRPGRRGQADGGAGVRGRAARRRVPRPRGSAPPRALGHPPRPHVGAPDGRARDAPRRRGRCRGDGRQPDAVRVVAAGVRARARGDAQRRGRQQPAQDARGAGVVRAPDPADRLARPGDRDGGLALPAGALRPVARRADRAGAGGATACRPRARRRARGSPWAAASGPACWPPTRAPSCWPRWSGSSPRRSIPGAADEPWRGLLARAGARRAQAEERGGGRPRRTAAQPSPRAASGRRWRSSSTKPPSARAAAPRPRCSTSA